MNARIERRSGFTLIELLIVIAIIAILTSISLPIMAAVKRKTMITRAKTEISSIELALSNYQHDTGRYPRRPGPLPSGTDVFRNDAPWLYAALRNGRTQQLGGGPNSSYLAWDAKRIAAVADGVLAADFAMKNPADASPAAPWVEALAVSDAELIESKAFQAAHLPESSKALVLLDPWGNPYVYQEWSALPDKAKESALLVGTSRVQSTGAEERHELRAHGPFQIISFGPNGVYELGEGDDIASWKH